MTPEEQIDRVRKITNQLAEAFASHTLSTNPKELAELIVPSSYPKREDTK